MLDKNRMIKILSHTLAAVRSGAYGVDDNIDEVEMLNHLMRRITRFKKEDCEDAEI